MLVGNTAEGFYEPDRLRSVARAPVSRSRRAWEDRSVAAEADKDRGGPVSLRIRGRVQLLATRLRSRPTVRPCWWAAGRGYFRPGDVYSTGQVAPIPDEEALRLWNREGFWINPPNDPPMVEALYDCYRDALQGPPPGMGVTRRTAHGSAVQPTATRVLNNFGNPVRSLGVTPQCAAEQFAGQDRRAARPGQPIR